MRAVQSQYTDPLDLIWTQAARQMGMEIRRSAEVFASWDGRRILSLGVPDSLDADDSLAQLIFHEICHALCEWPEGMHQPDWGLESDNPEHRVRELGCLRLQAALAQPHGLRQFLAATTVFRRYYDTLPFDPLQDELDPAAAIARQAMQHLESSGWRLPLADALKRTALVAAVVSPVAPRDSLWMTATTAGTDTESRG